MKKSAPKIAAFCYLVLALCIFLPSGNAYSKQDNDKKHKKWEHGDYDHKKKAVHHHDNDSVSFNSGVRDIIISYLSRNNYNQNRNYNYNRKCPPGLAKKNAYCMPPGQYKKYVVGSPLYSDVRWKKLPKGLSRQLPPPPANTFYGMVDNDVLLISDQNRMVLDAVSLLFQ